LCTELLGRKLKTFSDFSFVHPRISEFFEVCLTEKETARKVFSSIHVGMHGYMYIRLQLFLQLYFFDPELEIENKVFLFTLLLKTFFCTLSNFFCVCLKRIIRRGDRVEKFAKSFSTKL
jgi:hypothetical protein